VRAIVDAEKLAEVRAQATALLDLLDEMELCEAAAYLSMSVDALDRAASNLTSSTTGRVAS
jgi:hypothetical protein